MITEKKIVIHNGCQHKDLSVDLTPGRTYAATGPNACGKTNFIQLNAFAVTGVVDRSWGSQSDLNRTGTKDGYVEVVLEDTKTGKSYRVRRNFTTGAKNPDRLWEGADDNPSIVGREKVDEFLQTLYGVPMRVLSDLLWLRQGQVTWLLSASATSVYNFFNSLFDTSRLKKIKDILLETAFSIQTYDYDPEESNRLEEEEKQLTGHQDTTEELRKALKTEQRNLDKIGVSASITAAEKEEKILQLKHKLEAFMSSKASAEEHLKSLVDPAPWLKESHLTWKESYESYASTAESNNRTLAELKFTEERLHRQLDDVSSSIRAYEKQLAVLGSSVDSLKDAAVCPVCGASVTDHDRYVEGLSDVLLDKTRVSEIQTQISKLEAERKNLQDQFVETASELVTLSGNTTTLDNWLESNRKSYEKILKALKDKEQFSIHQQSIPAWEKQVQDLNGMIESVRFDLEDAETIETEDASVTEKRKHITENIKRLEDRLSSEVAEQKVRELRLKDIHRRREALERTVESNRKSSHWIERLTKIREGTQNGNIPKRFLADKISALNAEMASYCYMAELPIVVFLDPDDFTFMFSSSGDVRPAAQLSGAQKTLCATILQLAIVRVVGPKIGLLMLDEPSVFLDAENKGKLLSLFQSIRSILSDAGTVTIIPTHDEDLKAFCDGQIQLGR